MVMDAARLPLEGVVGDVIMTTSLSSPRSYEEVGVEIVVVVVFGGSGGDLNDDLHIDMFAFEIGALEFGVASAVSGLLSGDDVIVITEGVVREVATGVLTLGTEGGGDAADSSI